MAIGAVSSTYYALNRDLDAGERVELEPERVDAAPAADEPPVRYTTFFTGETPLAVAKHYGIPLVDLYAANRHIVGLKEFGPHVRVKIPKGSESRGSTIGGSAMQSARPVVGDPKPLKHTVRRDQTFSEIALFYKKRYGIKPIDLWLANPQIKNVHQLRAGETLVLPIPAVSREPDAARVKPDAKSAVADTKPSALPEPLLAAANAARNRSPEPPAKSTSLNPLPEPLPKVLTPIRRGLDLAGSLGTGFSRMPQAAKAVFALGTFSSGFDLATNAISDAEKEQYIGAFGNTAAAALTAIRSGARFGDAFGFIPEGNAKLTDLFPSDWGIASMIVMAAGGSRVVQDVYNLATLPDSATPVATHIAVRKLLVDSLRGTEAMIRSAPAIIKLGAATVPVFAAFTGLALLDLVDRLTTESPQERAAWVQEMKDLGHIPEDMPDPWSDFSGGTLERFAEGIVYLGLKIAEQMDSAGAVEDLNARAVYSEAEEQVRAMQWGEERFVESVAEQRLLRTEQLESDFAWDAFWTSLDSDKKSEAFAHLEKLRTSWQQSPTLPLDKNLERAIVIAANLYLQEHGKAWKFTDLQILHPPERRELNRYLDQALGPLRYSEDEAPLILGLLRELRQSESAPRARSS